MGDSRPDNPLSHAEPWDGVADDYVQELLPLFESFAEAVLAKVVLRPHQRVVDVATGPGTLACKVAPYVRQVDALDFSPAMLARCRERAHGLRNMVAIAGDGQALPYPNDVFDLGFSLFGLMFFPDRERGFRELFRVLRPGGQAFVAAWGPLEKSSLMRARVAAVRAADPQAPSPAGNVLSLEDEARFAQEMRAAGFQNVTIETVYREREFKSPEDLVRGLIRGNAPIAALRRALGEAVWKERREKMRAYLATQGPFPLRLGLTANVGSGRKAS
jgi:ubiquinone/menaquinone biosynthesis C-methylase UbiE